MGNPNIYSDFAPFTLGKYLVNIKYKTLPEFQECDFIEELDGYKIYRSNHPSHFIFINSDFYGLGKIQLITITK